MNLNTGQKVIAVDLDGTLAVAGPWQGLEHIGAPVPKMVERVKGWLECGCVVVVFTSRLSTPLDREFIVGPIERWCKRNIGEILPVTNIKTFDIDEFWDDRAVSVVKNNGEISFPLSNARLAGIIEAGCTGPAAALREMAVVFEQRNAVYKDNYKLAGAALDALFPEGMPKDQETMHLISLLVVKISRYINSGQSSEDSMVDAGAYCAMLADITKQRKQQKENK